MRRLAGHVDLSDVLLILGAACIAVPVYLVWSVWVWAYVGAVLIAMSLLRDMEKRRDADGPRR